MQVLHLVSLFEAYGIKAIISEKNVKLLLSSQQEREKTGIESYGRLKHMKIEERQLRSYMIQIFERYSIRNAKSCCLGTKYRIR